MMTFFSEGSLISTSGSSSISFTLFGFEFTAVQSFSLPSSKSPYMLQGSTYEQQQITLAMLHACNRVHCHLLTSLFTLMSIATETVKTLVDQGISYWKLFNIHQSQLQYTKHFNCTLLHTLVHSSEEGCSQQLKHLEIVTIVYLKEFPVPWFN